MSGAMDLQQQQEGNYADLPYLVLWSIMEKLTWDKDYVRFGATCVSWRATFLKDLPNNHSNLPFLLIPPFVKSQDNNKKPYSRKNQNKRKRNRNSETCNRTSDQDLRSLYSISSNKVCDFQIRVPHRGHCAGSSHGWLVTIKPKIYPKQNGFGKVEYYVQLHNPFLPDADHIHLPKLPFHNFHLSQSPYMYIHKVVLSSPPDNNLNKNFILMAIVSSRMNLAFFIPATKHFCWTPVEDNYKQMAFSDVIYFSKTQQFYAVGRHSGEVYAIDTEVPEEHPKLTLVAPTTDGIIDCYLTRYIVELPSGDLLQVIKVPEVVVRRNINTGRAWTSKFKVLKFVPATGGWVQIHDIGDVMVFVGGNSSICRFASEFPNCKPNCIYFTNESQTAFKIATICEDMGIYNLEDDSVQSHYSMGSNRSFTSPIWLEPTLKM